MAAVEAGVQDEASSGWVERVHVANAGLASVAAKEKIYLGVTRCTIWVRIVGWT